ncbi:Hypothetical predicted protein [Pelobates cultripes]|uniref:Uncharacterized protein n=2 Tax=Pelobates cultripes TaxID=61616 RepID=A0AAD1WKK5_PELCU|nr:Hypothetical predicted protein [Pelobates cultripes]
MRAHQAAAKMAPPSPDASSSDSPATGPAREESLTQIAADLATISANMMSKADKTDLLAEIRAVIREEVMEVRRDLTALERRVEELEAERAQIIQHRQATDTATTRQGNVLLELRRNLEDLDNRGRRNNIRVRGLPETAGEALPELLLGLFTHILGDRAPADFGIERAHRALRPVSAEGPPRDVICYLLSYSLKDEIMREARNQQNLTYMDAQISLYQDLSVLTLEARRALRPLTTLLRERRIQYKWGFPFSLQAKVSNIWHIIRWPADVPRFLRAANLPAVAVPNWVLERQPQRPNAPNIRPGMGLTGTGFRRGGPDSHEE